MTKLKGLGKGLDALFSNNKINLAEISPNKANSNEDKLELNSNLLDLALISPGKYQPRQSFDLASLQELSDSIKAQGVIQPIIIRPLVNNKYEIIAGERRFRACKMAGITQIPVIIRNYSDEEALAIALIENIQRKDLNIVEEAKGYRRLCDEFNLTHEALAKLTGKSRSNISNTLRLLNLSPEILELLESSKLEMGHARALLGLDLVEDQLKLASEIIEKGLTTAEVENKVAKILYTQKYLGLTRPTNTRQDPDILRLEEDIANKLGLNVGIRHLKHGNGKITINYSSLEELENFLAFFN